MYSVTLEINQICNLRCKYCYLGEKDGSRMDRSTALSAVDLAFKKVRIHKDRKLWFDFVGGEAFLDFQVIRDLVAYIEEMNCRFQYNLIFSVTTNAMIFTEEIVEFLAEKDFLLKISLDGEKEINDLNRISCTGVSVYDTIMENMHAIHEFERRTGKSVQVTNVITKNNYMHYYDTLVFLTREQGFKFIDTAIDISLDWEEEELRILEDEIKRSFDYFIDRVRENRGFWWEFANKVKNMKTKREKFYSCGAGIVSMYVRTDGSIYACPGNLETEGCMGSVKNGIDQKKVKDLLNFTDIDNDTCHQCEIFDYCVEKSCAMQNMAVTGDWNKPVPVFCRLRKLMYEIYLEKQDLIERLVWE